MKRTLLLLVALVASVVVGGVNSGGQATAIDSYGVGAVPAKPNPDNPRAKSIFIYQLAPGKTAQDGIRVINNTDSRKTIAVYPVDSELSSDGAFACKQQVEEKKNVGSWIKLAKTEVVLAAHTEEVIPFTVAVPATADVGEQNGCIAIQDIRKNEATGNGIVLSFRSALRVAVMVPGDVKTALTIKEFKVDRQKDKILASPLLFNSGNVSVDAQLDVTVKGLFGDTKEKDGGRFPILRDTESRFNIELDKPFWGGWYKVGGAVSYRQLQTTQEETKLSKPMTLPSRTVFVAPQSKALAIELGILAVLLGGAGYAVWRVLSTRRMRRKAFMYKVAEGDDIQSLATTYRTNWKTIAQLNRLKPPYHLAPGTTIKIPGTRPKSKQTPEE